MSDDSILAHRCRRRSMHDCLPAYAGTRGALRAGGHVLILANLACLGGSGGGGGDSANLEPTTGDDQQHRDTRQK